MKLDKTRLEELRVAISPFDTELRRQNYRDGKYFNSAATKDIEMRYRWDLYWVCGYKMKDSSINEDHIDTALRFIVKKLFDKEKHEST